MLMDIGVQISVKALWR